MQGGKKGRGPKASARGGGAPSDPNKERLMYMLTCLTGHIVTVKMNNGQIWEGNFHACSSEGDISITLKTARQVPAGRGKSGEVLDTMVINGKDFAQVSARNIPPNEPKSSSSAFKTDAEIAESWGDTQNRELVAWSAGGNQAQPTGVSMSLDSTRQIGTWDQFERNQQMFGITSTYSEDLYTTKLDPSKIPEQKRKDAERIAREIESGQNYSRIEEGADDVDEEAQFSAVGQHRDPIHAPLTMENVSQHDAASAELHGDGFAREHRAKRYMITAHSSRMPQLSEMKSINALNLEPALPKFDDKTRSDWINFKQSHTRQGQGNVPAREELQQSLQAIQQKEGNGKKPTAQSGGGNHRDGTPAEESKGDGNSKFSFNPSAKEFSFNPQATAFTPTGSAAGGGGVARNGGDAKPSSGSKKDTGGDKNSAMAPGPLQNARASGATKSFSDFLKPAKTGGKKQTVDDLLSRLLKVSDNPQNCSPNWESAKGQSYKEILGQPTAGNQTSLQLQQQMMQSNQMKMSSHQPSQQNQQSQQNTQQMQQQNQMQQMQMQQMQQPQQNAQQSQQSQQPSQMGMQMMQPQGGFIMAVPGCGNQQMLQQQMFQQMPGGAGRGNNSQGQGMQSQQQPQMQMGQSGQGQQQMGGCPQNMMGGQFVALQGNMAQGNMGVTGMGAMPKFGAQVVPMMVPAGQFPQGFMAQGMQGGTMQGMQPQMGDGMMPQMQNQMMQQGPMQGCGYRGMGGPGE